MSKCVWCGMSTNDCNIHDRIVRLETALVALGEALKNQRSGVLANAMSWDFETYEAIDAAIKPLKERG